MADKKITMDLAVEDKGGTINKRRKDAKELNKELEKSNKLSTGSKAGDAAARMSDSAYNRARGSAGATGAAGRDFANQAQGLGGLVRLYATYAANVFAVGAAFRALREAAAVDNMIRGMDQLGAASGVALGTMAKRFADASDGAISLQEAIRATTKATSAGLSSKQFEQLGKVAKNASQALGVDMQDAVSRLTRGITKLEPELLDELGLFTKIGPATDEYAKSIGKSASELTDFERRQAFANAVLAEGKAKFDEINMQANPYDKLSASVQNLTQNSLSLLNTVLLPIVDTLSMSPTALVAGLALIGTTLVKQALPAIGQYRKELEEASQVSAAMAKQKAAEAEGARAAIGQQSLQKLEGVAEAKIEAVDKAIEKVQQLDKSVGKNTQTHKILQKAIQDITQEDLKHLAVIEKKLRTEGNMAAADRYKEAIVSINNSIKAEEAYLTKEQQINAEIGKRLTLYQRLFTAQGRTIAAAEAAQNAATRKQLVSSAANDAQVGGVLYAYQNLSKGIKESNLAGINSGLAKLSGIATIATTAMAGLMGALASIGMWISLAVAAFKLLDGVISTHKEQIKEYKDASDTANGALETLANTTKKYNNETSIQGILAKATAMNEVTNSLNNQVEAFKKLSTQANFWEKLFTVDPEGVSKNVSKAVVAAMGDVNNITKKNNIITTLVSSITTANPNAANAQKVLMQDQDTLIKKLNKTFADGVTADALSKVLKNFNERDLPTALEALKKWVNDANLEQQNLVEPLRKYTDLLQKTETSYQDLTKDAKLKGSAEVIFANDTLEVIKETNAALKDQKNGLAAIRKLGSKDVKMLTLMFGKDGAENLKNIAEQVAKNALVEVPNNVSSILQKGVEAANRLLLRPFENLATKINNDIATKLLSYMGDTKEKLEAQARIARSNIDLQIQDIKQKRAIVEGQLKAAGSLELAAAAITVAMRPQSPEAERARETLSKAAVAGGSVNEGLSNLGGYLLQEQQLYGQKGLINLGLRLDKARLANTEALTAQQRTASISALGEQINFKNTAGQMSTADRISAQEAMSFRGTSDAYNQKVSGINKEISLLRGIDNAQVRAANEAAIKKLQAELKYEQEIYRNKQDLLDIDTKRKILAAENADILLTTKTALDIETQARTQISEAASSDLQIQKSILDAKIANGDLTADQAQKYQYAMSAQILEQQKAVALDAERNSHLIKMLDLTQKITAAIAAKEDGTGSQAAIDALTAQAQAENSAHDAKMQRIVVEADGQKKVLDIQNEMTASQRAFKDRFVQGFEQMGDAIVDFVQTGKLEFGSLIKSMLADMLKLQMRDTFSNLGRGFLSAIPGMFGGSTSVVNPYSNMTYNTANGFAAKGAAFSESNSNWAAGSLSKFEKGGLFTNSIVSSPTLFKFAKGTGLMGEAGPEAIMPLKRDAQGNLGVRGAGSKTEVVINNYTGTQVQTQEQQDSKGNRRVEVTIGEATADQVNTSGSAMNNSIGRTFGLRPSLIRR